jgi:hypothetical protein
MGGVIVNSSLTAAPRQHMARLDGGLEHPSHPCVIAIKECLCRCLKRAVAKCFLDNKQPSGPGVGNTAKHRHYSLANEVSDGPRPAASPVQPSSGTTDTDSFYLCHEYLACLPQMCRLAPRQPGERAISSYRHQSVSFWFDDLPVWGKCGVTVGPGLCL